MKVGALKMRIYLPQNQSLKGKRGLLKSISTRARNKFNISVAEIDDQELWQLATLGVACVGNDGRYIGEVLTRVAGFIENESLRAGAEVVGHEVEVLPAL
ncbi:DUF503 domain-containing protein [Chloroflexota bacterium]